MDGEVIEAINLLSRLSPESQREAAAFIHKLGARQGSRPMTDEERRTLAEVWGSMPAEDAEELLRITREAHDEWVPRRCR